MGCLYKITSPSGKSYIGITNKTAELRWSEHTLLSRCRSRLKPLQRAMKKYGVESFQVQTLVIADDWNYLCDLERRAIVAFNTLGPNGYNATSGGDGVIGLDQETRQRHRVATSIGTKAAWDNGSLRANRAAAQASPEFKERHRQATEASRAALQSPENKAKLLAKRRSPENIERVRLQQIRLWADPEYRDRMVLKMQSRGPNSPESRAKQSASVKATIARKKQEGTYKNPTWDDRPPESKAKLSASLRAAWAKRKAAKQ